MAVRVRCITDPACVWSWASEPAMRSLMVEFGEDLDWTFVMGGLAREFGPKGLSQSWLFCFGRKLDGSEALVEVARAAGLDVERFRIDLGSHATVEAFGADLEEARDVPDVVRRADKVRCSRAAGEERVPFPTLRFDGRAGEVRWICGFRGVEDYREAAVGAGALPSGEQRPGVLEALRRFGRMAGPEVAAVCDMALLKAEAELAGLALEWRVRPVPVLAGRLWEAA